MHSVVCVTVYVCVCVYAGLRSPVHSVVCVCVTLCVFRTEVYSAVCVCVTVVNKKSGEPGREQLERQIK